MPRMWGIVRYATDVPEPPEAAGEGVMNLHRSLRMWDRWAQEQGFPEINTYLYQRYVNEEMSLERLGVNMGIERDRVAQMLRRFAIPVRGRGGVR